MQAEVTDHQVCMSLSQANQANVVCGTLRWTDTCRPLAGSN